MSSPYADPVLGWYAENARDLPWRSAGVSPWAVLVSEIMLQQTPVSRVLPAYQAWLAPVAHPGGTGGRPGGRGGAAVGAARLPAARAAAARDRRDRHRKVRRAAPLGREELLALPGIGAYTAAAVAVFAFGASTPYSTPTCAGCSRELDQDRSSPARSPRSPNTGWPSRCCLPTTRWPPAGRSRSWSSAR